MSFIIMSTVIAIALALAPILYTLYSIVVGIAIGGAFSPPIGKEKMEKIFDEDRELLFIVTNYLISSDYEIAYIPPDMKDGEIYISGDYAEIEDVEIIKAINKLKERGYKGISIEDYTIHFQRWSNLDKGRGIAYSIDGSEPTLQFLTKLEPLSEPNWYYYEED